MLAISKCDRMFSNRMAVAPCPFEGRLVRIAAGLEDADDLVADLPVSIAQASLGTKFLLPTLEGEEEIGSPHFRQIATKPNVLAALAESRAVQAARAASPRIHKPAVQARVAAITAQDSQRQSPFSQRIGKQNEM